MKMLAEWFWTDRWMGSSGFGLPLEARGLYREMLTQAWHRGARLPKDESTIRRFCGVEREEWDRAWPAVKKFWREDGDSLVNDTQLEVYAEASTRRDRAQARGQAGAQAMLKHKQEREQKPKPPSPSPISTDLRTQPTSPPSVDSRSADDARSDLREALQDLRRRQHAFAEKPDQGILDCPVFHAPTGPVRIDSCANVGLLLATAGKVRAYGQPKPSKPPKARKGDPWGYDPDPPEHSLATAWVDGQAIPLLRGHGDIVTWTERAPEALRGQVSMILFARNPHLRESSATPQQKEMQP